MRMVKRMVLLFVIAAIMAATVSATVRVKGKSPLDKKFKVADNPPSVSQQIIKTFFSVALDSLITASDTYSPVIDPANHYLEISSTGVPLDTSAFPSPTVFSSPTAADMTQAEHFAFLVNKNQIVTNIEAQYWGIVSSARPVNDTDTSYMQSYINACNYLWADGVNQTVDSVHYALYKVLYQNLTNAIVTYNQKHATLSASDWYINSPIYEEAVSMAQQEFDAVSSRVVDALNTINTVGASLSTTMFSNAKNMFLDTSFTNPSRVEAFSDVPGKGEVFHVVLTQPPDWATNNGEYTRLSISSSNAVITDSSSYDSWSTGGSFGFFSWGAGGSNQRQSHDIEATDLVLDLDYLLVELDRPWLDDSLFGISSWSLPQQPANSVSNGEAHQDSGHALLPSYPSHFIIVKNLNVTATWSDKDNTYISSQVHGGGGFGFGCFSIGGGSYQSGSSLSTQAASFQNNVLSAPAAQIIGYVQKIVPSSPPLAG